jgi:hypothetical protein
MSWMGFVDCVDHVQTSKLIVLILSCFHRQRLLGTNHFFLGILEGLIPQHLIHLTVAVIQRITKHLPVNQPLVAEIECQHFLRPSGLAILELLDGLGG